VRLEVDEGLLGPGDEVVFTGRELDKTHTGVSEAEGVDTDGAVELGARPESDTDTVERGKVGTVGRPLEVELGPLRVADRLSVLVGDNVGVAGTTVPPEVDLLVAEGKVLVAAGGVGEPREEVLALLVGLLAPSGGKLALADGHVGEALNVAKAVHVELVLTEHGAVESTESVLGLLPVGVGEEEEALVLGSLPGHVNVVSVNGRAELGEELAETLQKTLLLRLVNERDVVDNEDILESLLRVDGEPSMSAFALCHHHHKARCHCRSIALAPTLTSAQSRQSPRRARPGCLGAPPRRIR